MEPIALYTWQALTLEVQHDRPQMAAELAPLLHDLSWVRTQAMVGGIGTGASSPQRGFGHRPIQRLPRPCESFQLIVGQ